MTPLLERSLAMVFSPLLLFILLISQTLASSCLDPTLTHSSHTSSSSALATSTVFIVSFDLACSNKDAVDVDANLYAVLTSGGGKAVSAVRPAAKSAAGYQTSFVGEHGDLPRGSYKVEIYDEEGFSALKKVQRAVGSEEGAETGGEAAAISPLAQIAVEHGGVGGGMGGLVRGETAAFSLFCFAFYLAHSAKSRIQSD